MNKITIPVILVATVMVAGIFAFMPVEQAATVHTTLQSTIGTLQVVPCANSMTGGDTTDTTCTFTTTGNAMIIHQITVTADAFASLASGGVTTVTTIDGVAPAVTTTLNTAATSATTGALAGLVVADDVIGAGVDGSLVTTTTDIVGGTAVGTVTVTLVATSTGTISVT